MSAPPLKDDETKPLVVLINPPVDLAPEMYKPPAKGPSAARVAQIKQQKAQAEEARIRRSLGQKLPKPGPLDGCCTPAKPKPGAKAKENARLTKLLHSLLAPGRTAPRPQIPAEQLDRVLDGTTIVMSHEQAKSLKSRFAGDSSIRKALVASIKAEIAAGGLEAKQFDEDLEQLAKVSATARSAAHNATVATETVHKAYFDRLKAASDRVNSALSALENRNAWMKTKEYKAQLNKLTEQGMKRAEGRLERLGLERKARKLKRKRAAEEGKKRRLARMLSARL